MGGDGVWVGGVSSTRDSVLGDTVRGKGGFLLGREAVLALGAGAAEQITIPGPQSALPEIARGAASPAFVGGLLGGTGFLQCLSPCGRGALGFDLRFRLRLQAEVRRVFAHAFGRRLAGLGHEIGVQRPILPAVEFALQGIDPLLDRGRIGYVHAEFAGGFRPLHCSLHRVDLIAEVPLDGCRGLGLAAHGLQRGVVGPEQVELPARYLGICHGRARSPHHVHGHLYALAVEHRLHAHPLEGFISGGRSRYGGGGFVSDLRILV